MVVEEKKHIYKITNKINGKIYIGQSINPKNRFNAHMKKQSSSKSISKDVDKYGSDNFLLEIIEENVKDFKESEKYWIKYYKDNGYDMYNVTKGGEEPPTFYGESHPHSIYSDKQLLEVIRLLKETNYNAIKIGYITNTNRDFVNKINVGKRPIDGVIYPIRTESHFDKIAKLIINDLKNTNIRQREIAKKYGVARSMVTMINIGENRHDANLEYPIRKERVTSITQEEKCEIIYKLKNGMPRTDAIEKYGHSGFINKINSKINKGLV